MDARERRVIEYDDDGEPRLYRFQARVTPTVNFRSGDVCVCGRPCAAHRDAEGTWIGCAGATKEGK